MTNFTELRAGIAFKACHQRGQTENHIKEAKLAFTLIKRAVQPLPPTILELS